MKKKFHQVLGFSQDLANLYETFPKSKRGTLSNASKISDNTPRFHVNQGIW